MSEIRRVVTPIEVDQECDSCYGGFMRPTDETLMCAPVKYRHKCTSCGYTQNYRVQYPYITHERVNV